MQKNKPDKPLILMVDDKPMNLLALSAAIQSEDYHIIQGGSGNEALSLVLDHDFALILLDVQMPDMDGFETAELIRSNPKTRHIPIIFVSAVNQEDAHLFKGYDKGAVDYLFKPVNTFILRSKIRVFMELYQQKKAGEILSENLKKALDEADAIRKIVEEQNVLLKDLSVKDGLTGLYNHRHMNVVMESEFNRAIRYKTDLACLLMDIDFFKDVNDTLGHPFGDVVLKGFADSLKEHVRDSDFLFRYGGEEFLVLLPQTDLEGAKSMAEKFRKTMEKKTFREGKSHTSVTVSIGVASLYTHHPTVFSEMISHADQALFSAKAEGRNRVMIYHEPDPLLPDKRLALGNRIQFMKESLGAILTKTKKASVASLELLVRDSGNVSMEKRNRLLREYITMLSYHMNLPTQTVETFKLTATIHDCFQALLGFEFPSSHSDDEQKQLPSLMAELAEKFDFFADERAVLLAHHEHYDGTGYPLGLEKDQIPVGARVFAIADAFVSLCHENEQPDQSLDAAVLKLAEGAGTQFDPGLMSLFLKVLSKCEPNKISTATFEKARTMIKK